MRLNNRRSDNLELEIVSYLKRKYTSGASASDVALFLNVNVWEANAILHKMYGYGLVQHIYDRWYA